MKFILRWTCNRCLTARNGEASRYSIEFAVRKSARKDQSLMTYLDEARNDVLPGWRCESAACVAARRTQTAAKFKATAGIQDAQRHWTIVQSPEILCICMHRANQKQVGNHYVASRVHNDVDYPEELDLSHFTEDGSVLQYRLFSVVAHRGPTVHSGHCIAVVRSPEGDFVTISDTVKETPPTPPDFQDLRYPQFGKEGEEEKYDPMLLFYLKIS